MTWERSYYWRVTAFSLPIYLRKKMVCVNFPRNVILTFTIGTARTLETASAATRQGSAVIPIELVGLDLELLGLAGTASRIGDPGMIWMQEAELRTATVALRIIAVATISQFLSQQPLRDVRWERAARRTVRRFARSKSARIFQSIPGYITNCDILTSTRSFFLYLINRFNLFTRDVGL